MLYCSYQKIRSDAPAIVYLNVPKTASAWAVYDAGALVQSLVLAAKERGIDSMVAYEFVKFPSAFRDIPPIPEAESIVIGIGLGYADDRKINTFRSDRQPMDDMLTIVSK